MFSQQYRKNQGEKRKLPTDIWQSFFLRPSSGLRRQKNTAAKDKIRKLREHNHSRLMSLSSVSLPRFSRARLRHAVKFHRENFYWHWQHKMRRAASESEILLGCLVLLLGKLKTQEGLARRLQGPRLRLYNDEKYSYETVTIYTERGLWLALQARALELEVSLSFLADLALRLFLQQVMARLEQRNLEARDYKVLLRLTDEGGGKYAASVGVDYLRNLLKEYSYQKRQLLVRHSHPARGKPSIFSLRLDYVLGGKLPQRA